LCKHSRVTTSSSSTEELEEISLKRASIARKVLSLKILETQDVAPFTTTPLSKRTKRKGIPKASRFPALFLIPFS